MARYRVEMELRLEMTMYVEADSYEDANNKALKMVSVEGEADITAVYLEGTPEGEAAESCNA